MKGILLDTDTGDLLIDNKGLSVGDNDYQCAEIVLRANKGELKEYPLIGAGVMKMINGIPDPLWAANAKAMLNSCGLPVKRVSIKGNIISLE